MRFLEILRSSVKALVKNKRRTVLTMIGIVIGIASVITIIALGKGFQNAVIQNLTQTESDEVVINILYQPKTRGMFSSTRSYYDAADLELAKAVPGVNKAEIGELDRGFMTVQAMSQKDVFTQKRVELLLSNEPPEETIIQGRDLTVTDGEAAAKVVILSRLAADEIFGEVDSFLGRSVEINQVLYRVVGIFEGPPRGMMNFSANQYDIYMPRSTFETFYAQRDAGNNLMLTISEGFIPKDVADEVLAELEQKGSMRSEGTYQVFDLALMMQGIGNILSMVTYFISAIAGISLLIAGVGVMNMMYISVSERTKEIGIRRALGATKSSVRNQFLLEGLTITMIGGITGLLLGILVSTTVSRFLPFAAVIDVFSILLTVIISSAIGLFFSVMPANSAAQKDLINILR